MLTRLAHSRAAIPSLIAAVSILSSVMSWRAAVASDSAADLGQQATLELLQIAQREAELDRRVEQDLRLLPRYEASVRAWRLGGRSRAPGSAEHARGELAVARALRPFFLGVGRNVGFGDADGTVAYHGSFVAKQLRRLDQPLNELKLRSPRPRARDAEKRAVDLVRLTALAIGSLLLLTIARFTRGSTRTGFAVGALCVAVVSLALFLRVELGA